MMDDFYIGYLPKAPEPMRGWLLKTVFLLGLAGIFTCLLLVANYSKSNEATFEYGIYKEIKGRIYKEPIPIIKVASENSYKSIILVNFGKAGVSGILERLEDSLEDDLSHYEVTINGSLIYYDGIAVLELSEEDASIIKTERKPLGTDRSTAILGEISLQGELIDSKCFFGVMKPGFGKIHRSCAVRCISGGVPTALSGGDHQYLFLETKEAQKLHHLIGKPIEVVGTTYQIDDLTYLKIERSQLVKENLSHQNLGLLVAGRAEFLDQAMISCDK